MNTPTTAKELEKTIAELQSLEALRKELDEEIKKLENEIKSELISRNVDTLEVGKYIVRFTAVLSQRFDTTTFKKKLPELYGAYLKQVESRRFTIS